jgi:hypothetical protein
MTYEIRLIYSMVVWHGYNIYNDRDESCTVLIYDPYKMYPFVVRLK